MRTRSVEGELEGVGEEIEDNLLPHVPIDVDRLRRSASQSTSKRRPACSMAERKAPASSRVSDADVRLHVRRLGPAGFDARKIEERVHQLQQPSGVAVQDVDLRALALAELDRARRREGPRPGRASGSAAF